MLNLKVRARPSLVIILISKEINNWRDVLFSLIFGFSILLLVNRTEGDVISYCTANECVTWSNELAFCLGISNENRKRYYKALFVIRIDRLCCILKNSNVSTHKYLICSRHLLMLKSCGMSFQLNVSNQL